MKMNLEGIKLTQEQVHCKNQIVDLAITYFAAKERFMKQQTRNGNEITSQDVQQLESELQILLNNAENRYGKWFADRCLEIARSLMGIHE